MHKEKQLRVSQEHELERTITKLQETFERDMVSEYQQQYLRVSLDLPAADRTETLRLLMAHLQHQFDIADLQLDRVLRMLSETVIYACLDFRVGCGVAK